jgi:hypothetical protein
MRKMSAAPPAPIANATSAVVIQKTIERASDGGAEFVVLILSLSL